MFRKVVVMTAALLVAAASVHAQEFGVGAGRFEIAAFPGGGMFFTESAQGNEPNFGNYALGGSFTLNVNRFVAVEGEGGATIGMRQAFNAGGRAFTDQKTPGMWMYSGNALVNLLSSDRALFPYATAGVGGLTLSPWGNVETLGVTKYDHYLTGNVGGGVKWFSSRHVGVRGDYRFFAVKSKDTAPSFFGVENRYGHRVQAGLIFTY